MSDRNEPTPEEIIAAADAAVTCFFETLGNHELSTGRFILLVESIGTDGERGIWVTADARMKSWETLGMLQYAVQNEQAFMVADRLDE